MRREMLTEDELRAALRQNGIDDLRGVEGLYIEQNGHFSLIKRRPGMQP
jgi:uncharacterized membrane protein YcaP (DUF421 family)